MPKAPTPKTAAPPPSPAKTSLPPDVQAFRAKMNRVVRVKTTLEQVRAIHELHDPSGINPGADVKKPAKVGERMFAVYAGMFNSDGQEESWTYLMVPRDQWKGPVEQFAKGTTGPDSAPCTGTLVTSGGREYVLGQMVVFELNDESLMRAREELAREREKRESENAARKKPKSAKNATVVSKQPETAVQHEVPGSRREFGGVQFAEVRVTPLVTLASGDEGAKRVGFAFLDGASSGKVALCVGLVRVVKDGKVIVDPEGPSLVWSAPWDERENALASWVHGKGRVLAPPPVKTPAKPLAAKAPPAVPSAACQPSPRPAPAPKSPPPSPRAANPPRRSAPPPLPKRG